ncbi:DNA-binding protein [Aromatoleum aromaticum]|uniref:DNA-binding protein n=1 Tax=Aromatoleum aromaticum TaxID=551760 RepID=UPI0002D828A4|nr:DNA-binding protein [Aromatoleum aromaticum]
MVRITEVQYDQVEKACTELFRAGETVSFAKVYSAIGSRGGQQVVSDMIRRWRQETAATITAKRENTALPEELVAASDNLVETVWKLALARAEESYQRKLGELAMKEAEWQVRLEAADEKVAAVERENLLLNGELKEAKATLQAREHSLAELETRLREQQAALAARDHQITALREDLARAMTTLESERTRHDEVLQAVRHQHDESMRQERERHGAELTQVHSQAEADRRHFMQQTDDLRQAHKLQAEPLREQLEGQKVAAESYRKQAYTARDEAARWQGRAEVAQEELAAVKKILAKVQRHREKHVASPTTPPGARGDAP